MRFIVIFLVNILFSLNILAAGNLQKGGRKDGQKDIHKDGQKDGFYVGVDASRNDEKIGKIDNSVAGDEVDQDRYYGYKFSGGGFFVAPEVFLEKDDQISSVNNSDNPNQVQPSDQADISKANANYGLKANIGYNFNRYFSGFLTYDVAKFSYDSNQGLFSINASKATNNSSVGIGSQVNFSENFGLKILYSQKQFESDTVSGQVKSDLIKIGTVYSF